MTGLKPEDALPQQAVDLLHQIQKRSPDQPEVLWYLGVIAAREGRPAEAREDWSRLLKQLPTGGEDAKMVQAALDQVK